jgi:acyl carrier protein
MSWEEKEVRKILHDFILSKFLEGEDPVHLTDTTPLVSGGVIDSSNSLILGDFIARTFSVELPPEDLTNPEAMDTIESISALILARLG